MATVDQITASSSDVKLKTPTSPYRMRSVFRNLLVSPGSSNANGAMTPSETMAPAKMEAGVFMLLKSEAAWGAYWANALICVADVMLVRSLVIEGLTKAVLLWSATKTKTKA